MYFVSYAAGQVLPTAVGGDAVRIIEHSRRRPDAKATAAGAVFMERVIGSAATLILAAVGLAVAAGRYEGARLLFVLEVVFVAAMILLGLMLFSRRLGETLERRLFPLGRRVSWRSRSRASTGRCTSTASAPACWQPCSASRSSRSSCA